MAGTRYKPEEIVAKLRQVDVLDQVATFMKRNLRVGCNSCIPEGQNS
jgi:hypothetical protein